MACAQRDRCAKGAGEFNRIALAFNMNVYGKMLGAQQVIVTRCFITGLTSSSVSTRSPMTIARSPPAGRHCMWRLWCFGPAKFLELIRRPQFTPALMLKRFTRPCGRSPRADRCPALIANHRAPGYTPVGSHPTVADQNHWTCLHVRRSFIPTGGAGQGSQLGRSNTLKGLERLRYEPSKVVMRAPLGFSLSHFAHSPSQE